jgi:hypothetical protein
LCKRQPAHVWLLEKSDKGINYQKEKKELPEKQFYNMCYLRIAINNIEFCEQGYNDPTQ